MTALPRVPWDEPASTLVLPDDVAYLVDRILSEPADWPIAWDLETTGLSPVADRVVGAALSLAPDHGVYLPLRHTRITKESELTEKEAKRKKPPLRQILGTEEHTANLTKDNLDAVHRAIVQSGRPVVMHNAGFDLSMSKGEGWLFPNALFDTRVAKWVLSRGIKPPVLVGKGPFSLKNLALLDLDETMTTFNEVSDPRGIQYTEPAAAAEYAAADARNTLRLWASYKKQLEDNGFWKVFYDLEMPCVHMIAHMRRTGFTLDKEHMLRCHEQVAEEQVRVLAQLSELVGQEYPATKAQKLSRLMYDTLKWWDPGERERGKARAKYDPLGFYPTDEEALLYQLKAGTEDGRKAALLQLRWRKLETMKVRYTKSFVEYVDADGRLRSDFNSMGADTGRWTSSDPPLQVLPRPVDDSQPDLDEWMKGLPPIRDAFIAPPGRKLIDIDFSQIELRVMAHLSRDPRLLSAYRTWKCGACRAEGETDTALHQCPECGAPDNPGGRAAKMALDFTPQPGAFCLGLDVHQLTAGSVGCSRQDAKPINFGLIYGMSSWLLAQVLDVDQDTADEYHARYFASYRGVAKYHANIENLLLKQWYVPTITGRHRRFDPVPVERNRAGRPKGEYGHAFRAATNTTVQGSAADIMKIAMRNVFRRMELEGHLEQDFWFVSTVHDELICEATDTFAAEAAAIMQHEFENAMKLRVPLVANPQMGTQWGAIH